MVYEATVRIFPSSFPIFLSSPLKKVIEDQSWFPGSPVRKCVPDAGT